MSWFLEIDGMLFPQLKNCFVNNAFQIVPELNQSKTLVIETWAIDPGVLIKNGITQLIFQIFPDKTQPNGI